MSVEDLENIFSKPVGYFLNMAIFLFLFINNYINFYTQSLIFSPRFKGETSSTNLIDPLASSLSTAGERSSRAAGRNQQVTPPAGSAHHAVSSHSTESNLQGSQCNKLPAFLSSRQSFLKWTQHLRKLLHGFAPRVLDQNCRWSGWGNNPGWQGLAGTLPSRMTGEKGAPGPSCWPSISPPPPGTRSFPSAPSLLTPETPEANITDK